MKLAFIGTGYVGLVSGVGMAEIGHNVVCVDKDVKKINMLKKFVMPIYELGLEELVRKNVKEGRLYFSTDIHESIRNAEVVFNTVDTPEDKKTGQADLTNVLAVAKSFGESLNGYKVLVNKSTVPVGTAHRMMEVVRSANKDTFEFDIVSNPEFLREGAAIKDFLNPDRIVIGAMTEDAKSLMDKIYRPLTRSGRPIIFTDVKSAEIIKYAANSFLATKISFINEIANFCDLVGGNAKEVARGMGYDGRIGSRFLSAGIGFGGSCFPKDVSALIQTGKQHRYDFQILQAADKVNDAQKMRPVEILKKHFGDESLRGKKIAVWGLSFKPRTDDIREAPSIAIIQALLKLGVEITAFDPVSISSVKRAYPDLAIKYAQSSHNAAKHADVLMIMTEWDEFRTVEYDVLRSSMAGDVIIDGRNILDRKEAELHSFTYYGIGV